MEKIVCGGNFTTNLIKDNINDLIDESVLVKGDVTALQSDVVTLETDSTSLRTDVTTLQTDSASLRTDVDGLKENTTLYNGIKTLPQIEGTVLNVKGFYADTSVGGGQFYYDPLKDKTEHNGGTVIAPEAIAAWDGTQADLATLLDWSGTGSGCFVKSGVVDSLLASEFGVAGDNPLNSSTCLLVMQLANKIGVGVVFDKNVTFLSSITAELNNISLSTAKGVTVLFKDGGFEFNSTYETITASISSIVNSYYAGDPYLPVTLITGLSSSRVRFNSTSHELVTGDIVKLAGDGRYPWITLEAKVGQMATVAFVDGADVWLDRELDLTYTYSKIFKLGDNKINLDLDIYNDDDAGVGGSLIYIRNYINPVANIRVSKSNYEAVVSAGNFGADITLSAHNIRNFNDDLSKFGYGLVDKNSESSKYEITCTKLRHGYTTTHGGSGVTPDCYGQARDCHVSGTGSYCIAPFDTHASGEGINFINCSALYSLGVGFSNRSNNTVYTNCSSKGSSDAGWQNFDSEDATTIGHNKVVTLINCTSTGHKRGLKSVSNTKKDLQTHRFSVNLIDCKFICPVYTECLFIRNTDLRYSNLELVNTSAVGSVTEGAWTESNPIFIRSYITLINSSFSGDSTLKLVAGGSALNMYPFGLQVDRSQNAAASNVIVTNGIYLDNSEYQNFSNFGELVISRDLDGKTPAGGAIDYTTGMLNNYLAFNGVMVHTKSLSSLMKSSLISFFTSKSQSTKDAFYYFNTRPAPEFNNTYKLANDGSIIIISTQTSVDFLDAKRAVDIKSINEKNIIVRCTPITPSGSTGTPAIDIDEIINMGGVECTGTRLDIINERLTGTVKVTATSVVPVDTSPKGTGKVATLIYTGFNQWVRV